MMLPLPKLTPPLDAVPGCTNKLFAPILAIVLRIAVDDPWPISIMAITAAMPMMIPRHVKTERMTFRLRAWRAIRSVR